MKSLADNNTSGSAKHIVIDARIRASSTGRYMDRLLQHLQNIDNANQYTVLLKRGDKWQTTSKNFTTRICDYKQFSFNPLQQISFGKYLKNLQPDLVHFGMTPQEPVFYNGKRITTLHDLTMLRFARAGKLPRWLHMLRMAGYRWLLGQSISRANHIIVPTDFVKQDLASNYPLSSNKISITHEASEPPLPGKSVEPKFTHSSQLLAHNFLLYVGTAFPHKNLEKLIEAFEVVHRSKPELKLLLVGKKEQYYERLEKSVADSPVRDSIIFTGFIPDEEFKWLYENASAFVFPSLSEGFGLPGLEAMVHGCPVVSSSATCLPEVYGDAAIYFDPNNVDDVATAINKVLTDNDLRSLLVARGFAQAKRYSWRRMAEQTLGVYNAVLDTAVDNR